MSQMKEFGDNEAAPAKGSKPKAAVLDSMLALPALILVVLALVIPTGWFFALSFVGADGQLSMENYSRIIQSPAYYRTFITTFQLSAVTVLICMLIGTPLAFVMATVKGRPAALLFLAVLLPFWTALLVRTYTWLVVLQRYGLVNSFLMWSGITDQPLPLINNFTGTIVGMVHIMLPVFVLPTYAAMKQMDVNVVRAALSLGASRIRTFFTIILPLAASGILAGTVLVFVTTLGFFVTPAILGGGNVTVVSMRIEKNISSFSNWGAASSLGVVLLAIVAAVLALGYWAVARSRRSTEAAHG
jgi:ABC-type spermidine/putrescine transport system permease subunit I